MGVASDAQAKPEHDRGKQRFPADWFLPASVGTRMQGFKAPEHLFSPSGDYLRVSQCTQQLSQALKIFKVKEPRARVTVSKTRTSIDLARRSHG